MGNDSGGYDSNRSYSDDCDGMLYRGMRETAITCGYFVCSLTVCCLLGHGWLAGEVAAGKPSQV